MYVVFHVASVLFGISASTFPELAILATGPWSYGQRPHGLLGQHRISALQQKARSNVAIAWGCLQIGKPKKLMVYKSYALRISGERWRTHSPDNM